MPTYEYQCQECGFEWEFEAKITAAPLTDCPKCHKPKAQRMISKSSGFILKDGGCGWYKNGYSEKK